MDEATERRGKPCWHLTEESGISFGDVAFNDAFLLESITYDAVRDLDSELVLGGKLL